MSIEDQFSNISKLDSKKETNGFDVRFHEQYTHREKMTYVCQEGNKEVERKFEFIDIHPDKQKGKDVYIAVGTPWDWEFMEDFAREIVKAGHRVMAIDHPNAGSLHYRPEVRRPAAMETFFKNKKLEDVTVVAHSVGFIDTMLKGTEGIGGVIAINQPGLHENSHLKHWMTTIKSMGLALPSDKYTKKEIENFRKMVLLFLRQNVPFSLKSAKDVHHVGDANVSDHVKKFKEESVPIITFRNVDDTLVPIDKVFAEHQDYRKLESGGNHLGPFTRPDQMQEVLKAIKELEQGMEHS